MRGTVNSIIDVLLEEDRSGTASVFYPATNPTECNYINISIRNSPRVHRLFHGFVYLHERLVIDAAPGRLCRRSRRRIIRSVISLLSQLAPLPGRSARETPPDANMHRKTCTRRALTRLARRAKVAARAALGAHLRCKWGPCNLFAKFSRNMEGRAGRVWRAR